MDARIRDEILKRYVSHSRRFEQAAAARSRMNGRVIPLRPKPQQQAGDQPTSRELEVLSLIADGLGNREIGERLYVSEETVKTHVCHLLAKLDARSRAHAVAAGFRRQIID